MKKMITWGTLIVVAALASCSGTDSKSKNPAAGGDGEAAGQPAAAGGDRTGTGGDGTSSAGESTSSAGTSSSGGDDAGQGGDGAVSAEPFAIEGTVQAPKGGNVQATVVIGCAWIDGECNEQKSQAVQVSKSGASGPYRLENLEGGPTYLVLFWKDMNDSGDVDDGDYVGVVADESGAARAFTRGATGADAIMSVQQAVAATDVPAELVGDWFVIATSIGVTNEWQFAADGTGRNSFTLNSAVCGGGAGTATNSQGVIAVDGDQLTYQPTSGQKTVKPCSGPATTTDYYTNPRHFKWRVGPSTTQAGTALFLTDLQNTDPVESEFQKL